MLLTTSGRHRLPQPTHCPSWPIGIAEKSKLPINWWNNLIRLSEIEGIDLAGRLFSQAELGLDVVVEEACSLSPAGY